MYRAEDREDQTPFCDLRTLSSCSLGQAAVLCCYKDKRILGLGCVIKNDLNICEYKLTERIKLFQGQRGRSRANMAKDRSSRARQPWSHARRRDGGGPGWIFDIVHSLAEYRRCKDQPREDRTSNSSKSKNPKAAPPIHLRNLSSVERTT